MSDAAKAKKPYEKPAIIFSEILTVRASSCAKMDAQCAIHGPINS